MCGAADQCSGTTPKCSTEITPATCEACDSNFCSQPLPYCVPTGETGAGSCQCGGPSNTCLAIQALQALLEADRPTKGSPFPTIDGPRTHEKVCIVGAGPAGIDMAVRLKDKGFSNLTIFEKTGRVGGKCLDTVIDGFYRPQGAALLTADYFDNLVPLAKRYNVGRLHPIQYSGVCKNLTIVMKAYLHH